MLGGKYHQPAVTYRMQKFVRNCLNATAGLQLRKFVKVMSNRKNVNHNRIPNSLRKYRKARGLTQKEVVRILGLKNTSTISRWEAGVRLPKPPNMFKLAVLYRVMADALFINLRRSLQQEVFKAEQKYLQNKSPAANGP